MIQHGVIDRFEGELAVIEIDGETVNFPKSALPAGAKAGDAVLVEGERISLDKRTTEKRRKEIEKLMEDVWEEE